MIALTLGRIAFINVMPVYYALEQGKLAHPFHLVYASPAELNVQMQEGHLAISSCSCMEYARRWERYALARDLCIASNGPVQSVLLLSKKPLSELAGSTLLTSGQSHTSVVLTKLLFQERYQIPVNYQTGNVRAAIDSGSAPEAVLTIGDEALSLRAHPQYPYVTDLATAWREWTGLPFVFALWIVNPALLDASMGDPTEYIRESHDWGLAHLEHCLPSVEAQSSLTHEELCFYYREALKFRLGERELQGLTLFYHKCVLANLLSEEPELRFFSS